ncbi:MAG: hypothetical protein JNL57_08315 [Bacteroidetes bacterium]|nr:hypothetical protein [Bacteroidota bacterium]
MKFFIEAIQSSWSWVRILRLVLGVSFVFQSVSGGGVFPALFGGLLLFQAISNTGCCSAGSCDTRKSHGMEDVQETVVFEEVKSNPKQFK